MVYTFSPNIREQREANCYGFFGGGGGVSQGYIVWEMLNLTQLKMLLYSRTLQGFSMLVDTLAGQSR